MKISLSESLIKIEIYQNISLWNMFLQVYQNIELDYHDNDVLFCDSISTFTIAISKAVNYGQKIFFNKL
jgi:hypothetical protein